MTNSLTHTELYETVTSCLSNYYDKSVQQVRSKIPYLPLSSPHTVNVSRYPYEGSYIYVDSQDNIYLPAITTIKSDKYLYLIGHRLDKKND
jgi:hypothetical protein